MNNKISIHPLIRRPLILLVTVLAVSMTIVIISSSYEQHADDGRQAEKRSMRIWKSKIDGARESNSIIDEYERGYQKLIKNNVMGEEDRLDWLENIQAVANSRNMPSVKYNLSSQQEVKDVTGQLAAQGLKVYRSDMTLDMKLAHEGDLFAMLNSLEERAKGLFTVDQCIIEKLDSKSNSSRKENMTARCELGWYTFRSATSEGRS